MKQCHLPQNRFQFNVYKHTINVKRRLHPIFASNDSNLVILPIFEARHVLLPTNTGRLHIFEPKYVSMFSKLHETEKPGRFLHLVSNTSCPPSFTTNSGYPPFATCCVIDRIITRPEDGTLLIDYHGHRRSKIVLVEPSASSKDTLVAATTWYDDQDSLLSPEEGSISTTRAAERDVAAIIKHIQKLHLAIEPTNSALPDAVAKYAPPLPSQRLTSYDTLKQARHKAASAIDTWRRHGSVYGNAPTTMARTSSKRSNSSDPYASVMSEYDEDVGWRRAELFSFAVTQLLEIGTPERCALLLSQSTIGRLQYFLKAAQPYLQELSAKASLKGALG